MPKTPLPIVTLSQDELAEWLNQQDERTRNWINSSGFVAKAGTHQLIPDEAGSVTQVIAGVGLSRGLYSIAQLPQRLPPGEYSLNDDWQQASTAELALGFALGSYQFDRYQTLEPLATLRVPEDQQEAVGSIAATQNWVRDLVNTPTEQMGPEQLGDAMAELAARHQARFEAIVGDELLEQNFPAVHAVGRAADSASGRAPRLLRLDWGDSHHPHVVLAGKGVCFDTGGLNIKTGNYMVLMKKDMGGAAHALGVARLVMEQQLPVHLTVLIPAVENAVDGNAYRPGDVVETRLGKTVEIGNTDAEGRVVLADALALGSELKPELMIDFATLTGAARIAMGPDLPPLFATNDEVAEGILAAGKTVQDPLWRLPLYAPYLEMMHSSIADLNNSASSPMGGCITAALFLQEFVGTEIDWCHIDTYAWNRGNRPGRPKGGEAQSLRAVFEYLRKRYAG